MAETRGGIRWMIDLLLRRSSAKKVEQDVEDVARRSRDKAGGHFRGLWDDFGKQGQRAIKSLGGLLAGLFVTQKITNFFRSSIQTFKEADAIWTQLRGTLATVGVEFDNVSGRIGELARHMQDTTTMGDEDFAQVLQRLIQISGDYEQSLANVATVADFAAGANIDYATASRLVGLAMMGDTAMLKRYGVVVKEGEDAIVALRRQFKGMAENEAESFSGKLKQLSNEWGDFKEAVGQALVEAGNGASVMDTLVAVLRDLATWTANNIDVIARVGRALVWLATTPVRGLVLLLDDLGDVLAGLVNGGAYLLQRSLEKLARGFALVLDGAAAFYDFIGKDQVAADARQRAAEIRAWADAMAYAAQISREAAAGNFQGLGGLNRSRGTGANRERGTGITMPEPGPATAPTQEQASRRGSTKDPVAERIALYKTLHSLNKLTEEDRRDAIELERQLLEQQARGNLTLEQRADIAQKLATLSEILTYRVEGLTDATRKSIDIGEAWAAEYSEIMVGFESLAYGVTSAVSDAFAIMAQGFDEFGEGVMALFTGLGRAVRQGLADMASAYVKSEIAAGLSETAKAFGRLALGDAAGAALHFKAAGTHAAAALAWAALSGMASGGGRSPGRGGGIAGGARDAGGRIADRAERLGVEFNVFIDPLDPARPAYQENVYAAQRLATERFGEGARINIRPRTTG